MFFAYLESDRLTDTGRRRKRNEDAYFLAPEQGVFCLADGMGGEDSGDVASQAVIDAVEQVMRAEIPGDAPVRAKDKARLLARRLDDASRWICQRAAARGAGVSGSTVTLLIFDPARPEIAIALHAGDSPLLRFRDRELKQLTRDHSFAAEANIANEEDLPPRFRGMITRAVGIKQKVNLESTPIDVAEGDIFLLCSDGLTKMVPLARLQAAFRDLTSAPLAQLARHLVDDANAAGGVDNVTVVLVRVGKPTPVAAADLPAAEDDGSDDTERETSDDPAFGAGPAEQEPSTDPRVTPPRTPPVPPARAESVRAGNAMSPGRAAMLAGAVRAAPRGSRGAFRLLIGAAAAVALVAAGLFISRRGDGGLREESRPRPVVERVASTAPDPPLADAETEDGPRSPIGSEAVLPPASEAAVEPRAAGAIAEDGPGQRGAGSAAEEPGGAETPVLLPPAAAPPDDVEGLPLDPSVRESEPVAVAEVAFAAPAAPIEPVAPTAPIEPAAPTASVEAPAAPPRAARIEASEPPLPVTPALPATLTEVSAPAEPPMPAMPDAPVARTEAVAPAAPATPPAAFATFAPPVAHGAAAAVAPSAGAAATAGATRDPGAASMARALESGAWGVLKDQVDRAGGPVAFFSSSAPRAIFSRSLEVWRKAQGTLRKEDRAKQWKSYRDQLARWSRNLGVTPGAGIEAPDTGSDRWADVFSRYCFESQSAFLDALGERCAEYRRLLSPTTAATTKAGRLASLRAEAEKIQTAIESSRTVLLSEAELEDLAGRVGALGKRTRSMTP